MLKEYVFWLKGIKRNTFFVNFLWDIPQKLIKVVITDDLIKFDGPIEQIDSQDILAINLLNLAKVSWSVTSPGSIGYVEISTQESQSYYLIPVNPFDPTLVLVQDNTDELIAFCNIVDALRNNQPSDFDESPYSRQFQKKAKPSYLKDKKDIIFWDKNISPLKYYYEFLPKSKEKEMRFIIQVYKLIILILLLISVFGILYMLYALNNPVN